MKTIHALLVGINDYHPQSGVASLKGCVGDTQRIHDFLVKHFGNSHKINVARLTNEESTYDNIVNHFGEHHLLKAQEGDTILFYYSGHGAREKAAKEFDKYFPEGYNESIVCYESRAPNGKDLADKEMAVLVSRLSATGAHVVIIMDCCHSGSGTKEIGDFELGLNKQTYDREKPRPYESYLNGWFAQNFPGGEGIDIPTGKHILLAACKDKEKAYELKSKKAFFTTFLLKVLEKQNSVSYADLYSETRASMRRMSDGQHPQFETYGHFDAFSSFITGDKAGEAMHFLATIEDDKWIVQCGAVNGLPTDADKKAEFELFHEGRSVGFASATKVGIQKSNLQLDFEPHPEIMNLRAKLISLPDPGIAVETDLDEKGKLRLDAALKEQQPVHVEFTTEKGVAPYLLKVREYEVQIINAKTNARLRTIKGEDHYKVFADTFLHLDKIAKWEKALALQNQQSKLSLDDVEIILEEKQSVETIEHKRDRVVIDTSKSGDRYNPVNIGVKIANNNKFRDLFCSLFYFSQDYMIMSIETRRIPPASQAVFIPKNTLEILPGFHESTDIFKVYVSTEKIDDFLIGQEAISLGDIVSYDVEKSLFGEDKALGSTVKPEQRFTGHDWFTKTMIVKTVGQENKVGSKSVEMADGMIKVMPHASLTANLSMTIANAGTKDIEQVSMVPKLMALEGMEMLNFGDTKKDVYGSPNVLELTNIQGDANLKDNPLEIMLNTTLGEDEDMLPLTFDGEHLLPIGEAIKQEDGTVKVEIRHLPETQTVNRKSVTKALKMVFMKLVLRKTDLTKLCWVDYSGDKPKRVENGVAEKVASAKNIIMVIHGIIGDTIGQCECMQRAVEEGSFDLVLSFDYENLNTPIEQTAQFLKDKLIAAGLDEGHNKNFWILAHSMGGLVSRYFIEILNGKAMVRHLIMAGTPNGGSSIGDLTTYRDSAITLMGFVLNSFSGLAVLPYLALLRTVLKGSQKVTYTLGQMKEKGSQFIKTLENSAPPGIPYSIIAGHLFEFIDKDEDAKSLMDKMFKMGGKLFYGDRPNDLAVAVESIKHVHHDSVATERVVDLPGHHLNYFSLEESVDIIYDIIQKGIDDK
ncbi:MAG: caspase family protein [Bacteroidota bacterium]